MFNAKISYALLCTFNDRVAGRRRYLKSADISEESSKITRIWTTKRYGALQFSTEQEALLAKDVFFQSQEQSLVNVESWIEGPYNITL